MRRMSRQCKTSYVSSSCRMNAFLGILILSIPAAMCNAMDNSKFLLQTEAPPRERQGENQCAMYDICGSRSDGKVLNCPYSSPAVKPDGFLSSKIQSLCPTITGNICCTEVQFDTLRSQVQQAIPFLVGCPACLRNFLNLFCEFSCSPNQSLFINVTSLSKEGNNMTVEVVDFYVSDEFGEGLYNSCKDVKFGSMNTRALDYVGAGASNFTELFAFIGNKAAPGIPGSPFTINFFSSTTGLSGFKSMNVSTHSCDDTTLGCSCGDCPSSLVCSRSPPSTSYKKKSCSIKMGRLKAKCMDFVLAVFYAFFLVLLLGWALFRKSMGKCSESPTKPLLNMTLDGGTNHSTRAQVEKKPVQEAPNLPAVETYMSKIYRKFGILVARNPTCILCLSFVLVLPLSFGLLHFKVETQPEKLWVGHGSKAAQEKHFFDVQLSPFYRIEQLIIATIPDATSGKSPSIVTDSNIKLLFDIQNKVDGIRANYSGSTVSLTDICMKPLGEDCATQSVLQYFKMDPANFDDYGAGKHAEYCFQHYTSEGKCLSSYKAPLDPSTALGGFSGINFLEASAFIVTYPVNNVASTEENHREKAVSWEKAFIQLAKDVLSPLVQSENLTLSFSSESSIEEELKRESTADAVTILISYLVMFAYISMTLGDIPCGPSCFVSSKILLGLSGVLLVIFSVLGSIGFFSAIGVKSTLIIIEVIPFLVLAVGVDNMCILVHAVKRQPLHLDLEGRISNALTEVGPSITIASLSEVLAFGVGSFVPMPACRVFSMFAALAVLLDFILQVTAFVALIVFDVLRSESGRADCFPCVKIYSSFNNSGNNTITGTHPRKTGLLNRYMKDVHAYVLSIWTVKILVVSIFSALAVASIALCRRIQPGLEQQIVLPHDSYLQGYFNNVSEFLRIGPPLYFVVKDYNYSIESGQTNRLCSIGQCDPDSLLNEISRESLLSESSYIAKPAASWLDDYLSWISPDAFSCCRKFPNGSYCPPDDQPPCCSSDDASCGMGVACKDCTTCFHRSDLLSGRPLDSQFREKLPWFLNALPSADCAKGGRGAYSTSVELNGSEAGVIRASSFRTYHTPLTKQIDYINAMKAARSFSARMSESLKMSVFPYSMFYIFFEQYLNIWSTALITLALAVGAVFFVCSALTCSLWSSVIIVVVLIMIIVDVMGVMAILGIQLNAISVVNLVMSVGIAVEFCVHIAHAFLVNTGDREQRMKEALGTMGASIFSGITLTKLVGVTVLHFSKTRVFVVYYFQMYLALVLLGFVHGVVFLPVVLSIWGPPSKCAGEEGDTPEDQQR